MLEIINPQFLIYFPLQKGFRTQLIYMIKSLPLRTNNMASFLSRFSSQRATWVPIAVGSVAVAASLYYTNANKSPLANETPVTFKGDDQWIDLKVS